MVVPDGWFNYTCFGEPIRNTRILAAKTPLKQTFNSGELRSTLKDDFRRVALEEEFTPTQLMDMLEQKHHTLGLVIDLTFTSRYYSPREFEDHGVMHVKILCPGRDIPDDDVYTQFAEVLNAFLADPTKKEKIVAVHCTHGLNRTGYLICRYLLEECHYEVEDAIDAFNHARGHCIERKNYLDHLRMGCPKLTHELNQSNGTTSNRQQRGDVLADNRGRASYHRPISEERRPLHLESGQAFGHTRSPALQCGSDGRPRVHRFHSHSRPDYPLDRYYWSDHSREHTSSSRHGNASHRRCVYSNEERSLSKRYESSYCSKDRYEQQKHRDRPYSLADRLYGHANRDHRRYSEYSSDRWSSDSSWEPRPVEQSQQHRKPPYSNSSSNRSHIH